MTGKVNLFRNISIVASFPIHFHFLKLEVLYQTRNLKDFAFSLLQMCNLPPIAQIIQISIEYISSSLFYTRSTHRSMNHVFRLH